MKTPTDEEIKYGAEMQRFQTMKNCLLHAVLFSYYNTIRDGISQERNFFLRMVDDVTQSVIAIDILAKEGVVNTCLRELRYLIELSIKASIITQNTTKLKIGEQIEEYKKLLNSSNINPINDLKLKFFDETTEQEFKASVKRTYGLLCNYTHSSSVQITERIARSAAGRTIGFEGSEELSKLNDYIENIYSFVIVFIFNSVPDYVAGDYLVESDGSINPWYFKSSKFISKIDEKFDYKHERKTQLEAIKRQRQNNIKSIYL
ncbi:hypothetical protein GGR28_003809 [Lewinella aquimaris]|uniref:Uncharacterized protein n=1 Tax=Neolewinella aquimaris TaxID=1835722 RepID=A0A840EGZ8_9BACT|nr:hypothetical protein [Neolewinella aquimaris]MBB4081158.1 hypothetical protein [Neolewinella aquimaris]